MRELFDCSFFDKSRDITQYKISYTKFSENVKSS